jgi:hypothetical protein
MKIKSYYEYKISTSYLLVILHMHFKGYLHQTDIQDILRCRHAMHHILNNTYVDRIICCQPSLHHARLCAFTF